MNILAKSISWFIQNVDPVWGTRFLGRLPKSLRSGSATIKYRDCVLHVYTGEEIGQRLYFYNRFESEEENSFLSLLATNSVVFDVGANLGVYSVLAAKQGAKVYAFEPSQRVGSLLRKNISSNHFENKIEHLPIAVSDKVGELEFFEGRAGNWGVGRIFAWDRDESNKEGVFSVATKTLDGLVEELGQPDVIKIDIEGAEWLALQGAKNVLASTNPPDFILEVHPVQIEYLGGDVQRLIENFTSKGFTHYKLIREDKEAKHKWYLFSKKSVNEDIFERA